MASTDKQSTQATPPYIGRFAPTPSGALHFGSLLAALASFLDARAHRGRWLVRMEDLDRARASAGAADQILRTLDAFHLHWDDPVTFQSQRFDAYQEALVQLRHKGLTFECCCSRQRIQRLPGVYDGHCRETAPTTGTRTSIRLRVPDRVYRFDDQIQGAYQQNLAHQCGDFVLLRRDAIPAYQLAVVVDDAWQGVTDIVRGYDLLDSTPRQLYLQAVLDLPRPRYAHIPLACTCSGQKLSKQNLARPLQPSHAREMIHQALRCLGQQPPGELITASPEEQIRWAIGAWDIQAVPKLANIPVLSALV